MGGRAGTGQSDLLLSPSLLCMLVSKQLGALWGEKENPGYYEENMSGQTQWRHEGGN